MFNFLKEKLKGAISKLTKKVEKEIAPEEKPIAEAKAPEAKSIKEIKKEEAIREEKQPLEEKPEQKKPGFLQRIFGAKQEQEAPKAKEEIKSIKTEPKPEPIIEPVKKQPVLEAEKPKKELPKEIIPLIKEKPLVAETKKPISEELLKPKPEIKPEIKPAIEQYRSVQYQPVKKEAPKPELKAEEELRITKEKQKPVEIKIQKTGPLPVKEEKKGFFGKIIEAVTTKTITEQKFEEMFWDLEVALLENNVAVEVIDKIKDDMKKQLVDVPIQRNRVMETIESSLKKSIADLFDVEKYDLLGKVKAKKDKPYIIAFVGVNGSGKTTTIAKVANLLKKNRLVPVIAAADTFRAAAIDQLEKHANNLGVKLIKHDYGSDAAAVAFDAIKHAKAANKDVVLIDTAGRLHSNINLMDELRKVIRVAKPDSVLFIGESITGNDCVEQAKKFDEAAKIDGIILAKADVDEKGGAAVSISYVTKKPILYLGVGQGYDDLREFEPDLILRSIGLET